MIAESGGDITDTATYAKISKQFSYDAWGLARDATDWDNAPANAPNRTATDRGYTGHEMLDELGLIHMNGRIYDPLLGRFLSADPHIQAPGNLQNYNRYSYVLNNPLSITDPSGFFFDKIKKHWKKVAKFVKENWKTIVTIAIAALIIWVAPFGAGFFAAIANGALAGAVSGATGAALHGGDVLKGALYGGLSGAAFGAVGGAFGSVDFGTLKHLAKVAAHGVTGGTMNELQGGEFGHGFAAAAAAQLAAPGIDNLGTSFERVTAASVLGGTVSELTGGSFENGAVTGAFSRLFNDELPHSKAKAQAKVDEGYGFVEEVISTKSTLLEKRWLYKDINKLKLSLFSSTGEQSMGVAQNESGIAEYTWEVIDTIQVTRLMPQKYDLGIFGIKWTRLDPAPWNGGTATYTRTTTKYSYDRFALAVIPLPPGEFIWSKDLNSLSVPDPSKNPRLYSNPRRIKFDQIKQKNIVRYEHN